jgi:LemA protein
MRQKQTIHNKNNKGMGTGGIILIVLGIIALIILMVILWVMGIYNSLVQSDVSVEKSWGNVQTAYTRRADLIPNIVATVKGSAAFEKETQTQIAGLRSGIKNAATPTQLDSVGKEMNSLISNLIVSVEAYPDLKSSQNFLALQDELAGTENRIKWERDNYNEEVKGYKLKVRSFPNNVIAGMFGFNLDKWTMFQGTAEDQEAPEVDFS